MGPREPDPYREETGAVRLPSQGEILSSELLVLTG